MPKRFDVNKPSLLHAKGLPAKIRGNAKGIIVTGVALALAVFIVVSQCGQAVAQLIQ